MQHAKRRTGDTIRIEGDYQHLALTRGPRVQRFWHRTKLLLLDWMLDVHASEHVLDVGCGSGVFADALACRGASVLGVDANPDAIAYATQTFARPGLTFTLGLLDELHLPVSSFDKVVCLEIIEHVYLEQVRALLQSLHTLLKPSGQILITTPNYHGMWPAVEWVTDRFSKAARMNGEQHVTHFNRATLHACLDEAGFDVDRLTTYSTFAPFVAAASVGLAERIERLERHIDLPFGNLLVVAAHKR